MFNVSIDLFKMYGSDGTLLIEEDFQDKTFDGVNPDTNGCWTYGESFFEAVPGGGGYDFSGCDVHTFDDGVVSADRTHINHICTVCGETVIMDYEPSGNEEPPEEPDEPEDPYDGEITLDYILGKVFTNGRRAVSNNEFRSLALRMWLVRHPDRVDFRAGHRYVIVNCQDPADLDAAEVMDALGLNPKYIEFYPVTTADGEEGGTDVYFYIGWTTDAYNEFDHFSGLSNIEELYLNVTLYNVSGNCKFEEIPYLIDNAYPYVLTQAYSRDVNLDGSVNLKDVLYMRRYIAGSVNLVNIAATDLNGDGVFNLLDLPALKSIVAGS